MLSYTSHPGNELDKRIHPKEHELDCSCCVLAFSPEPPLSFPREDVEKMNSAWKVGMQLPYPTTSVLDFDISRNTRFTSSAD